jgi:hypothetical protein
MAGPIPIVWCATLVFRTECSPDIRRNALQMYAANTFLQLGNASTAVSFAARAVRANPVDPEP